MRSGGVTNSVAEANEIEEEVPSYYEEEEPATEEPIV